MTWLQFYNRQTKRGNSNSSKVTIKAWKRPSLPFMKKEKRYDSVRGNHIGNGEVDHSTPNTSSWNGVSSPHYTVNNHEPMDISSPPPSTYKRPITISSTTPKKCTMNGTKNHHPIINDTSKIEIDMLTLKAIQTEFFGLDKHHKSVHDIVLALADSDVVMLLHTQNRSAIPTTNFSAVTIYEQQEEARENRIKQCEKELKDALMRISNNVSVIKEWKEFENLLEDILILPREEEMKDVCVDDGGDEQDYLQALTHVAQKRGIVGPHEKWRQVSIPLSKSDNGKALSLLDLRISDAQRYISERNQAMEDEVELRMRRKEEEELTKAKLETLLRPLEPQEKTRVDNALYGKGPQHEIIAEMDNDSVTRLSIQRLRPGQWLNDEIIHFYFSALSRRDAERNPNKRCHFFKSFFLTKLLEEGGSKGAYKYSNVKRWSKKVHGKDIFALDKIFFPVNVGNMHWATACIFIQKKMIRFYDSLGGSGTKYLNGLFQYLQDEWTDKKKCTRDDWGDWKLIGYTDDIPQQHNGFDCGVFTCMFADFLSRDMPLSFTQEHITPFREHITLSILNGKAL